MLGIAHQYAWTFEVDKDVRKIQSSVCKATLVLRDVMKARPGQLEPVDALMAGFPCQPFSIQGLGQGINDHKHRGIVVFSILDIIDKQSPRPRLVVLENVVGLLVKHKPLLSEITRLLASLGYTVRVWVLNALNSGVPQNRARVWILGFRTDCLVALPEPPKNIKYLPSLTQGFLDLKADVSSKKLTKRQQAIVKKVSKKLKTEKDFDVAKHPVIIDVQASAQFSAFQVDRCPTLTRSRAMQGGFYVLQRGSMMSLDEIAALMAIPPQYVKSMRETGVDESTIAGAMGNAQSINILERILGPPLKFIPRVAQCLFHATPKDCVQCWLRTRMLISTPTNLLTYSDVCVCV